MALEGKEKKVLRRGKFLVATIGKHRSVDEIMSACERVHASYEGDDEKIARAFAKKTKVPLDALVLAMKAFYTM